MNVVFGDAQRALIEDKHITLELDTVRLVKDGKHVKDSEPVTIYGIIGPGDIPIVSLPETGRLINLHEALIKNYKIQNWSFCEQAIEQLTGKWTTVVDEFYVDLYGRILVFKKGTADDWSPMIDKEVQEIGKLTEL